MNALKQHLAEATPGPLTASDELERIVAECWDDLDGSDEGGMEACKLLGRMEQVVWTPPMMSFVIERHGGLTCGSTRAEVQHWAVNLDTNEATISKESYRQVQTMAPRAPVKATADEITQLILGRMPDSRLQWRNDDSVSVLLHKIYPKDSGSHRTVTERRNRFRRYVEEALAKHDWYRVGRNRYSPLFSEADFEDQSEDAEAASDHSGGETMPTPERGEVLTKCRLSPQTEAEINNAVKAVAIDSLKELIVARFKDCLVWRDDECVWDRSGELVKLHDPADILEELISLSDVLNTCTGEKSPTYQTGCGWAYETWELDWEQYVRSALVEAVVAASPLSLEDDETELMEDIIPWGWDICHAAQQEAEVRQHFDHIRTVVRQKVAG